MEKIKSFIITQLTLSGFKAFSEPCTFRFGAMTAINGHNGQGKTSIGEAIIYAITGIAYGSGSLDRLYTLGSRDVSVELTLLYPDGTAHTLTRSRVRDQTAITYDGVSIRQSDLSVMFGEKDVFLSIFNPLYFIEELGEKGRSMLERYLPAVPHEAVLETLPESQRALVGELTHQSPEVLLEKLRCDIRDFENDIVYLEGQRDLLSSQGREQADTFAEKQELLAAARERREALEAKKTQGLDMADLERKLALRRNDAYQSANAQAIGETAARFESVKAQYGKESATLAALRPGVYCPTCKQAFTDGNIEAVRQSFKSSIDALMEEGRALRGRLEDFKALEAKALAVFRQYKADDLAKLEHLAAYGNLSPEEAQILAAMAETVAQLEQEIAVMAAPTGATAQDKEQALEALRLKVREKRNLETALKLYVTRRSELQFKDFDMLQRVSIALYEAVKSTGELKNVFKFSYDGKPYSYLSLSEKIKAGLELSELMKQLTQSDYPVFIDNGESVPVIDNIRPTGQVFIAQVVKAAPLTVQALDETTSAQRKAA